MLPNRERMYPKRDIGSPVVNDVKALILNTNQMVASVLIISATSFTTLNLGLRLSIMAYL
jgi:hypothetical protein